MGDPYIGEIRMFGGTFAPVDWLFCDGSSVEINNYQVLFQLIGTTYGGDGQTTFNLPDLRGRVPVHQGNGISIGQTSGSETVTLQTAQLPQHTHPFQGSSSPATVPNPGNNVVATAPSITAFRNSSAGTTMSSAAIGSYGGGGAHTNIQPFQCVNFIICTNGIFPSQS